MCKHANHSECFVVKTTISCIVAYQAFGLQKRCTVAHLLRVFWASTQVSMANDVDAGVSNGKISIEMTA